MGEAMDHYAVLGIAKDSTEDHIKKTFRVLAKQYHPDKNADADAEEKFKQISAAYDILKDRAKRKLYDMEQKTDELRRQNEKAEKERAEKMTKSASFSFTTKNGTSFTFQSTYSSFDDDKSRKKESKDTKDTENGEKKKKGGAKKYRGSKTFSFGKKDWDNDFSSSSKPDGPRVSFQFGFEEDPMEEMEDMFDDFFSDKMFSMPGRYGFSTSKKHKKKTTPEEDMWDWTKPLFGKNKAEELYEDERSMKGPAKDYAPKIIQFPCVFCGKNFSAERVKKHEKTCNRREAEEEAEEPSTSRPYTRAHSEERPWRRTDDDYDQAWTKARTKERSPDPTKGAEFVKCVYCLREFSAGAVDRHMARCDRRNNDSSEPIDPLKGTGNRYYTRSQYGSTSRATPGSSSTASDADWKPSTPRAGAGGFSRASRDYMDEPLDSTSTGLFTPRRSTNNNSTSRANDVEGAASSAGFSFYLPSISAAPATTGFDRAEVQQPSPETAYERYQKRYYSSMDTAWKTSASDYESPAWKVAAAGGGLGVGEKLGGGSGGGVGASASGSYGTSASASASSHEPTPTPSEPSSTRSGSRERSTDDYDDNRPTIHLSDGPTIHSKSRFGKKSGRGYVGLEDLAEDSEEDRYSRKQQDAEFAHARRVFTAPRDSPTSSSSSSDYSQRYRSSDRSYTSTAYIPTSGSSASSYIPEKRFHMRYSAEPGGVRTSRIDVNGPVIHLRTSSEPNYRGRMGLSSSLGSSLSSSRGYTGTGTTHSTASRPTERTYTSEYRSAPSSVSSSAYGGAGGSGSYFSSSSSSSAYGSAYRTAPSSSAYLSGAYGTSGSGSYFSTSGSGSYLSSSGSGAYGGAGSGSYGSGAGSYGSGSSSTYVPSYSNLADSYAGRVPNYQSSVYSTSVA